MTQEYTPVAWQDETTSQQGTLINAERLNQMQQAHHYADGLEEVDAVPTADPGVSYHKIVYCTADSTIYRWDGTEWTKDIDDETKALLQQEIARATEAEGELAQDIADEETARETADTAMQADISALQSGKLDKKTASPNQWQVYGIRGSSQIMINAGLGGHHVPLYGTEEDLLAKMPTLGLTDNTVVNYGWATAQIGAEATARADADTALGGRIDTEQARAEAAEQANAQAIANTYTKAEIDTALGAKADVATTYSKTETDALLALKADQATTYTKAETDTLLASKANDNAVVKLTGNQTIQGAKTFYATGFSEIAVKSARTGTDNIGGLGFFNASGNRVAQLYGATDGSIIMDTLQTTVNASIKALHQRAYSAGNTTDVATIGTLDAYTPMVRTTGNQSISGTKIFSGDVGITGAFNNKCKYYGYISAAANYEKIATLTPGTLGGAFVGMIYSTKGQTAEFKNRHGIFYARVRNTDLQIIWMMKGSSIVEKQLYLTYDGSKFELWGLVNYDAANEAMGFNLISESNAGTIPYNLVTINTDDIVKTEAELSQYQLSSYSQ